MNISEINSETRLLCDADTTTYPAADLLRRVNSAYEEIVGKIIGLDGAWQFDDTNYTTFPIGTIDLLAGQYDYAFDTTFLNIEKVAVKYNDGKYYFLDPVDKNDVSEPLETLYFTNGIPLYYDKQGQSVLIYPAPASGSVTLTAGLKVYFQRTASVFTSAEVTTGTKVPGFASPFHILICYKAALLFCQAYKPNRVAFLLTEINRLEKDLMAYYGKREKDVRKVLRMKDIRFR